MEQTPLPTTIPEVEQLILALYQPQNTPAAIANIQDVLQCLQKSPQGWQVAKQLLDQPSRGNQDDQIRFFGALTIIIKLNTERHVPHSSLTDDDAQELLQSLLQWLISAATGGSGALVVQKLCHALVSFFVQFSHLWPNCVRHVLVCLNEKRNVPLELVPQPSEVPQLARALPWELLRAIPSFLAKLVEDVGKTDMNAIKHTSTHRRLIENAQDATALLSVCLAPPLSNQDHVEAIKKETLDCIQSWIFYAQRVSSNTEELVTPLRTLVEPTINCLANESSYQAAVELLTEVLSNYSRFFTEDQYAMLASIFESQWAQQLYNRLTAGDYDDVDVHPLMFGLFMIAYGDAKVLELMQSPDQRSQQFLSGLCGLLGTRGYPVAEDKIFVPALEFWSTFIETMTDSLYSDEDAAKVWRHTALAHVMQVVGACWKKIQYPSMDTFLSWDSSERAGFGDARKDVADLLQTTYSISGQDLISLFVDLLLQSLPTKSWAEIEAAAFCLSSLSDCISDEGNCDDLLSRVFSAPLFDLLSQNQGPIPVKLRQTALSLIERYSEYFERRSEYLPAALSLLFDAVGVANLAGPSSKSIATLCSSCRSTLTSEAGAFLGHYQTLHTMQNLDPLAEERIVAAIASIIQAIPEETRRLQAFEQLFGLLRTDINRCIQLLHKPGTANTEEPLLQKGFTQCQPKDGQAPGVNEVLLQIVHLSMRCLASMAKGMQATSDGPVDLEADSPDKKASPSQHLLHVQSQVMALMVEVQSAFPKSGEVVDTICNAMKAGFSETEPGPFVFQPEMVSEFFTRQRFETPRIGVLVSTACCFVSALSTYPKEQVKQNLTTLLPWVVSLLHSLPEPDADTELAQNGIDFVSRLMTKHPEVLFQIQPTSMLEFFFMFTLKVLNGHEPLPKASSADFWTSFITLRSADAGLQSSIDGAMEHLGPLLAQALVQNIGGGASRSELDRLSDPLKKLVVSHVRAQSWLERALADPSFPSDKVSAQDKSVFLKRIVK